MLTRDACRTTSESFGVRRIACIVPVWATTQRTLLTCGAPLPRGEGDLCGMPQYAAPSQQTNASKEQSGESGTRYRTGNANRFDESAHNAEIAEGQVTSQKRSPAITDCKLKRLRGLIVGVAPARAALPQ